MNAPLRWDLFCRVIDNHGDLGVCWRLSCELARRGHQVRLWCDDASALAWMAPQGQRGVEVLPWLDVPPPGGVAEVVVEAFGCEPPPAVLAAIGQAERAPAWINLEYLSAEAYVARCHALPSPVMAGPAAGRTRWFFYPGFTAQTGGLLRTPRCLEPLVARRPARTGRIGARRMARLRAASPHNPDGTRRSSEPTDPIRVRKAIKCWALRILATS
jgi:uncharacterized repeat protein (TIGR03837 family)